MLRSCNVCGKDLPAEDTADPDNLICSCGATFPACPECSDGWLIERKGKWGKFLSCVRYPDCMGRESLPKAKERS
ncbi:topoisomerase DNA-binding C4 zinc finger domain-containing protein [Sulfitobacter sp. HGT1]|uniref:topoisomerase DNA-binding C4 zinc finger domain-containing protein n=1 Tax=Sulfitobacter sp. HGT1 TaxID=2735435 RepID=UPI001593F441|nr:topoisomerase DNA-binding C4 zinc finger domain-containing protein [Sulfitobacter sp. HGT1]